MRNIKTIIRAVVIIIFVLLPLKTTGQSLSPDEQLEQVISKLDRIMLLKYHESNCCFHGIKFKNKEKENSVFPSRQVESLSFGCRFSKNTTRNKGGGIKCLILFGFNDCFSGGALQGNDGNMSGNYNMKDTFGGGALIHNTSFLSQPVIKLGFRF